MCMFEQLLKEYEDKLREEDKKNENKRIKTAQYNFYLPKIRDYFIPFIRDFIQKNNVSAKYSCGFSNLLDSSIIVNER